MSDRRDEIDLHLASGDVDGARRLMAALWREAPGLPAANFLLGRAERLRRASEPAPLRVALLRSFTLEPVVPLVRAGALAGGLDLDVRLGDFNAWAQELLDPAGWLRTFDPQVILLAVDTRDLAPALSERLADLTAEQIEGAIEEVLAIVRGGLDALRLRSSAHVVLHNFERPARPATGLLAAQAADPIERLNAGLRELARGHRGVYLLDYDALVARHGRLAWNDPIKWLTVRQPIRADCLLHLAEEWLRFLHPLGGRVCKVLVCDLDNTLWGGVVGEEGLDALRLADEHPGAGYRALQRAILDLARRGILLAVCSKNNEDEAMRVLTEHPDMLLRPNNFAAFRINWRDKAENLREIAVELGVGIDALAFIDDNPAECELVRSLAPQVTVIELPADPLHYAETLRRCPVFERLDLAEEDRSRSRMYAEQRQRRDLERVAGSLEEFYESLEMRAEIAPLTAAGLTRAAQLTQKTNQFNLTTRRYSEQQLATMAADPTWSVFTMSLSDRFGDNGTIAVAIVHRGGADWEIDTFLLSCRVIGRTAETALLATLAELAAREGARALVGSFLPTKKNAPARGFYPDHGFALVAETATELRYRLDLRRRTIEAPPWIARRALVGEARA